MNCNATLSTVGVLTLIVSAFAACGRVERSFGGGDGGAGGGQGSAEGGGGAGPVATCGDGRVDPGEICEDGNATDGDGCDSNCTPTSCGNKIITQGEACDDGNSTDGDGCDSNCTPTGCGNKIITQGEACDDGNSTDGDGCDSNCTPTGCGNNLIDRNESCDDGNLTDGDGCDSNCTPTGCGNRILTPPELCDGEERCREDCKALVFLPADVRGIRRFVGNAPILLSFLAVKAGTEDRVVAEFNLYDLPPTSTSVQLAIDLQNSDPGGPEGYIDVYWYRGDTVVNPDEFNAGTFFESRPANEPFQTVAFDVSALIADLRASGSYYLGVRLSTASSDRYWLDQAPAKPPRLEVLAR